MLYNIVHSISKYFILIYMYRELGISNWAKTKGERFHALDIQNGITQL